MHLHLANDYCAIDFGTSNSALVLPENAVAGQMRLAKLDKLEEGAQSVQSPSQFFSTLPTAVFYHAEDSTRAYGRSAIAAYIDGYDGRLMRSMKSILGTDLMEQTTEIGLGLTVKYADVVGGFLRHLKTMAEQQHTAKLEKVVLGRPVFFVDGDPGRDAKAQNALASAAHAIGFKEVAFQYEPIAAALDYESRISAEKIVLVADIGGGTSDFSIVKVSPARHTKLDRADDILGNFGVHIAGTDFDRAVNLASIMPLLGLGSLGPDGKRVPGSVYFDLATWHLINTVYGANRVIELKQMASMYADKIKLQRLIHTINQRLGHHLAAKAESAKIAVSINGTAQIDLDVVEEALCVDLPASEVFASLADHVHKIVAAAKETVHQAGLKPSQIDALYFTGGSTGLSFLSERIGEAFSQAERVFGDRFASVAMGLGIYAQRRFA